MVAKLCIAERTVHMLQSQAVSEPTDENERIWKAKKNLERGGQGIHISKQTLMISRAMNTERQQTMSRVSICNSFLALGAVS
jgi:hypothetical protein